MTKPVTANAQNASAAVIANWTLSTWVKVIAQQ
jgi:hypothetical protein